MVMLRNILLVLFVNCFIVFAAVTSGDAQKVGDRVVVTANFRHQNSLTKSGTRLWRFDQ